LRTCSKSKWEKPPHDKSSPVEANCLGWCHKGPVMLVNDEIYPDLTPQKAIEIIEEYAKHH
jgi:NADH-quinone oxidoreductase subunit E